jgi:hypothetical protein
VQAALEATKQAAELQQARADQAAAQAALEGAAAAEQARQQAAQQASGAAAPVQAPVPAPAPSSQDSDCTESALGEERALQKAFAAVRLVHQEEPAQPEEGFAADHAGADSASADEADTPLHGLDDLTAAAEGAQCTEGQQQQPAAPRSSSQPVPKSPALRRKRAGRATALAAPQDAPSGTAQVPAEAAWEGADVDSEESDWGPPTKKLRPASNNKGTAASTLGAQPAKRFTARKSAGPSVAGACTRQLAAAPELSCDSSGSDSEEEEQRGQGADKALLEEDAGGFAEEAAESRSSDEKEGGTQRKLRARGSSGGGGGGSSLPARRKPPGKQTARISAPVMPRGEVRAMLEEQRRWRGAAPAAAHEAGEARQAAAPGSDLPARRRQPTRQTARKGCSEARSVPVQRRVPRKAAAAGEAQQAAGSSGSQQAAAAAPAAGGPQRPQRLNIIARKRCGPSTVAKAAAPRASAPRQPRHRPAAAAAAAAQLPELGAAEKPRKRAAPAPAAAAAAQVPQGAAAGEASPSPKKRKTGAKRKVLMYEGGIGLVEQLLPEEDLKAAAAALKDASKHPGVEFMHKAGRDNHLSPGRHLLHHRFCFTADALLSYAHARGSIS